VTLDAQGVQLKPSQDSNPVVPYIKSVVLPLWSKYFGSSDSEGRPSNANGAPDAMVEEVVSPSSPDRTIVLIALKQDSAGDPFAGVLLDRSETGDITGSVSLLRNSRFESFSFASRNYHVGSISWYAMMRIWLTQYFLGLLLVVTAFSFVLAYWTRGWLARHANERVSVAGPAGFVESPEE